MVQPSAIRVRATCSVPIGAPRKKRREREGARFLQRRRDDGLLVRRVDARLCRQQRERRDRCHGPDRMDRANHYEQHSIMIPAVSLDAYAAARERAGLVDRPDRGRVVVSGADRARFYRVS
jgi:hypothetical protein